MKFIPLFLLLLLLSSCSLQYTINDQGGMRPKEAGFFNYKKHPFHLQDTLRLDTNSIYITHIQYRNSLDSARSCYVYYRFFNTGQVRICSTEKNKLPTTEEINNMKTGTVGYYKIKKNGRIKIEYLILVYTGRIQIWKARFDGADLLIHDNDPAETMNVMIPKWAKTTRFKKMKIAGMTHSRPDW